MWGQAFRHGNAISHPLSMLIPEGLQMSAHYNIFGRLKPLLKQTVPVSTEMQVRDCQFQMRMVWSSLALTIQGCSWWNCTVRM